MSYARITIYGENKSLYVGFKSSNISKLNSKECYYWQLIRNDQSTIKVLIWKATGFEISVEGWYGNWTMFLHKLHLHCEHSIQIWKGLLQELSYVLISSDFICVILKKEVNSLI